MVEKADIARLSDEVARRVKSRMAGEAGAKPGFGPREKILIPVGVVVFGQAERYAKRTGKLKRNG